VDNKNIQVESSKISNWGNFDKVEMHINTRWADNVIRLQSYSTSGSIAFLYFQQPDQTIFVRNWMPVVPDQCYFFENAYEFIDTAGEWYLNQSSNTLYYKARQNEDMAKASMIAPYVETLVKIMGDSLGRPTHDIWMQGITFAHSTYLQASDSGYLVLQAGLYSLPTTDANHEYDGRPASAVYVACAHNLRFERNIFTQLAATGLDLNYGTHDDIIIGNSFSDIGGSGILIAKFFQNGNTSDDVPYNPADTREICANDSIISNSVSNVSTEIYGTSAIACGYPQSIRIEHNEVCYCNYTGISVGWGWTSASNPMKNNYINWNNIHHVLQILCDGGAIYTLSKQPNSQLSNNYVHDFQKSSWADYAISSIYLDEQTSGFTISNNVRINVPCMTYSYTYNNNISSNNDGVDSNVIKNSGIEAPYNSIPLSNSLILEQQQKKTESNFSPPIEMNNKAVQFLIANGRILKTIQNKYPVTLFVTDFIGRKIMQKTISGISTIDLKSEGLAKGIYFIRGYSIGQKSEAQKINIIQ
jgi:hypothetical protein